MSRRYNGGFPVVAFLPMRDARRATSSLQAVEMMINECRGAAIPLDRTVG
jgi:hypothetical protein